MQDQDDSSAKKNGPARRDDLPGAQEPLDPEVAESWNEHVRVHGLPLGKYRTF